MASTMLCWVDDEQLSQGVAIKRKQWAAVNLRVILGARAWVWSRLSGATRLHAQKAETMNEKFKGEI